MFLWTKKLSMKAVKQEICLWTILNLRQFWFDLLFFF